MEIKIQSIHFDADSKLTEFVEKKVKKLETFFDRVTDADIYLKLDNASTQVKDKVVEVKLNIPGTTLFAKGSSKTFEKSTDLAVDQLRRQIKKYKDKIRTK